MLQQKPPCDAHYGWLIMDGMHCSESKTQKKNIWVLLLDIDSTPQLTSEISVNDRVPPAPEFIRWRVNSY